MAGKTIPKIMSTRTVAHLDKLFQFGNLVNRDYEGEISKAGDTVIINQIGDISVGDYVQGELGNPENITSTQKVLTVDQKKKYEFYVDDIEAAQSSLNLLEEASKRTAVRMADEVDSDLAEVMAKEAGVHLGSDDAPVEATPENIYDLLVEMRVAMSKNNVPQSERSVVLTPELIGYLEKDARFVRSEDVLRNGFRGRAAGFDVHESNNVHVEGDVVNVVAVHKKAVAFASNIVQSEVVRSGTSFGDIVRGLYVYGRKVIQPEAVVNLHVKLAAPSIVAAAAAKAPGDKK